MNRGYQTLLVSGELERRADALTQIASPCRLCPRKCETHRARGERGECGAGTLASLVSFGPHHGEESCLSGVRGSGTLFFGHCNLHCTFCQNHDISQNHPEARGMEVEDEVVAEAMLRLAALGCHNINWVSPSHCVAAIMRALVRAARKGLRVPIVYNSNGYDSLEVLGLLDGVVDIYMPDLKYADDRVAERLSSVPGYVGAAQAAISEMHRQVGPLEVGGDGLARRGLLIRHLVLPDDLSGTLDTLDWIAGTLGTETTVNVMAQYHPAYRAGGDPQLGQRLRPDEYRRAVDHARQLGFRNLMTQPFFY